MEDKNPSMQEILSSIRRIIAEDSDDFGATQQRGTHIEELEESKKARESEASEASEASEESQPSQESGESQDSEKLQDPEKLQDSEESPDARDSEGQQDLQGPEGLQGSQGLRGPQGAEGEGLLSSRVESEVSESFDKLRNTVVAPRGDEVGLHSLVSDLVRPLLREWLDAHLPDIIERLVREEIRRLAGRGGGD